MNVLAHIMQVASKNPLTFWGLLLNLGGLILLTSAVLRPKRVNCKEEVGLFTGLIIRPDWLDWFIYPAFVGGAVLQILGA